MLLDVFPRVMEHADDVVVVEAIEGLTSRAAHADEVRAPQETQLMRHGRLGEPDQRREVTHAPLAERQGVQNLHPGRIAEEFEDVGNRRGVAPSNQAHPNVLEGRGVDRMGVYAGGLGVEPGGSNGRLGGHVLII